MGRGLEVSIRASAGGRLQAAEAKVTRGVPGLKASLPLSLMLGGRDELSVTPQRGQDKGTQTRKGPCELSSWDLTMNKAPCDSTVTK